MAHRRDGGAIVQCLGVELAMQRKEPPVEIGSATLGHYAGHLLVLAYVGGKFLIVGLTLEPIFTSAFGPHVEWEEPGTAWHMCGECWSLWAPCWAALS